MDAEKNVRQKQRSDQPSAHSPPDVMRRPSTSPPADVQDVQAQPVRLPNHASYPHLSIQLQHLQSRISSRPEQLVVQQPDSREAQPRQTEGRSSQRCQHQLQHDTPQQQVAHKHYDQHPQVARKQEQQDTEEQGGDECGTSGASGEENGSEQSENDSGATNDVGERDPDEMSADSSGHGHLGGEVEGPSGEPLLQATGLGPYPPVSTEGCWHTGCPAVSSWPSRPIETQKMDPSVAVTPGVHIGGDILMVQPPMQHDIRPLAPTSGSVMQVSINPSLSLSPSQQTKTKKKKKKMKHVQLHLDPLAHQKLMKLVSERHAGSLERFVNATVSANGVFDMHGKRSAIRKPALNKWKRTKFDTLKGQETQELAMAFRALAESNPGVDVSPSLLETPWQDLTMAQMEKMLDETKKMLALTEKVHDCTHPGCGRRFATPGNLRDHLNEHSGERPYICTFEGCSLCFPSKQLLCRHMKKHERSHKCTFEGCNKRFAFRERLVVHQKTHSDERPLSCPWEGCGKTFKWANSLHGHMRTHTGEKPFQCTFTGCGRLFGYKVDLTRHVRTHFGQPARLGSH